MLISHRKSAYVDDEELERARGLLQQRVGSETCSVIEQAQYEGAALALFILLREPGIKTAQDFELVFRAGIDNLNEGE